MGKYLMGPTNKRLFSEAMWWPSTIAYLYLYLPTFYVVRPVPCFNNYHKSVGDELAPPLPLYAKCNKVLAICCIVTLCVLVVVVVWREIMQSCKQSSFLPKHHCKQLLESLCRKIELIVYFFDYVSNII